MCFLIRIALASLLLVQIHTIRIENFEYHDIVVEIKDSVPESICGDILTNLEVSFLFFLLLCWCMVVWFHRPSII